MNRAKSLLTFTAVGIALLFVGCGYTAPETPTIINESQEESSCSYVYSPIEIATDADPITDLSIEVDNTPYTHELCYYCGGPNFERQPTPPLNILDAGVDDKFLSAFETVHTVTYLQWEADWHHTLAFWPDEPLRDFSFLSLGFHDTGERMYFYTREVLLTVEELLPTDTVVLNVLFFHYLIPRGGLVFTDENGVQRRMLVVDQSVVGGCSQCILIFILSEHDETHFADWG